MVINKAVSLSLWTLSSHSDNMKHTRPNQHGEEMYETEMWFIPNFYVLSLFSGFAWPNENEKASRCIELNYSWLNHRTKNIICHNN